MSQADPMTSTRRELIYLRDRNELTPAQRRRARHKENVSTSDRVIAGVGRHGRLARRYDRVDNRNVKAQARTFVAWVKARRSNNGKQVV